MIVLLITGFFVLNSFIYNQKQAPQSGSKPVTIHGQMTCLPKTGSGMQTLECAIGVKDEDGNYYGLENLSEIDPEYNYMGTDEYVEISGLLKQKELKGPDGNVYDIVGVIEVYAIDSLR